MGQPAARPLMTVRARRRLWPLGAVALALWLALPASAHGFGQAAGAAAQSGTYDLAAAERLGGHTLARHVGKSDRELSDRLQREPRISAASTYTDRDTAERVIAATLARSASTVRTWLARSGSKPNLVLDYAGTPGQIIGRSLRRHDRLPLDCTDAVVVLRWHARERYYVLTSYPERRRP